MVGCSEYKPGFKYMREGDSERWDDREGDRRDRDPMAMRVKQGLIQTADTWSL